MLKLEKLLKVVGLFFLFGPKCIIGFDPETSAPVPLQNYAGGAGHVSFVITVDGNGTLKSFVAVPTHNGQCPTYLADGSIPLNLGPRNGTHAKLYSVANNDPDLRYLGRNLSESRTYAGGVFTEPLFEKDGTKFYGVRFRSDINSKQFDRRFGSYLGLPDEFKDEAMQRLCDAYGVKFIKLPPNPEGVTSKEFIEGIKPARPRVEAVPCTTQGCTPKIVTTQAQNSPPTNTSFQSTPRTGLFRGFFRGVFNTGPFTPGGIAERGLGLWEGSEEVIEYIRNNRRELGTMATTYMGLAKYYSGYAGKVVISYAPTAGTTVGLGSAAIAPAAISLANLEYSQSQINAAKANGGFIPISGPVQTAGPNSIWVYGRVYAGPNGQLYQATSWGFSPVYNTYSDWWNGTQATAKR